jgi:hypothetical protein
MKKLLFMAFALSSFLTFNVGASDQEPNNPQQTNYTKIACQCAGAGIGSVIGVFGAFMALMSTDSPKTGLVHVCCASALGYGFLIGGPYMGWKSAGTAYDKFYNDPRKFTCQSVGALCGLVLVQAVANQVTNNNILTTHSLRTNPMLSNGVLALLAVSLFAGPIISWKKTGEAYDKYFRSEEVETSTDMDNEPSADSEQK